MDVTINPQWKQALQSYFDTEQFELLTSQVRQEYLEQTVFPQPKDMFRAFDLTPFEEVKVVILGQDPYHTPGVADGLSFSAREGNKVPPSLQNIYKEIGEELYDGKYPYAANPDLTRWAQQGVLMLNNTLTVRAHTANSHQKLGWEHFTNEVISIIAKERTTIVFLLWGNFAGGKKPLIEPFVESNKHLILSSAHPSPFSARNGFMGNNHFIKTNEFLYEHSKQPIIW
jgi:uracil-DNA glycosylase